MSNIYNRRLDYEVYPSGKRVLERPTSLKVPNYAVVGNTAPNLNFNTNRMLQPLFATKKPIPQRPFNPKQPINASGLGGRQPIYIDYTIPKSKPRPIVGLKWEPNSIREARDNVYPDGVPKNLSQLQQADSAYLEQLNNDKKRRDGEERLNRLVAGRPRPLTDAMEEKMAKELEDVIAEGKYGKGAYKNIALSAEGHAKLAQQQADDIRNELKKLQGLTKEQKTSLVTALSSVSPQKLELELGDPKEEKDPKEAGRINDANDFIRKFKTSKNSYDFEGKPYNKFELIRNIMISNGLDDDNAELYALKIMQEGKLNKIRRKDTFNFEVNAYVTSKKLKEARKLSASKFATEVSDAGGARGYILSKKFGA